MLSVLHISNTLSNHDGEQKARRPKPAGVGQARVRVFWQIENDPTRLLFRRLLKSLKRLASARSCHRYPPVGFMQAS